MPNFPKPLQAQFEQAIGNQSDYQLGQMWAAETDENPIATMARARRWRIGLPKSIVDLALLLDALGYRLAIVKK